MPDFRIVEIVFDKTKVYYRYEAVGKSDIGGEVTPPYPEAAILGHFRRTGSDRIKKNKPPTDVEDAAINASRAIGKKIHVLTGSKAQARACRIAIVKNALAAGHHHVLNHPNR